MNKRKITAGVLFVCLLLAGCGSAAEGSNEKNEAVSASLEMNKDGSITETIAEDFSQSYYDAEELKNYIISEVARHNGGEEKDSISIDRFEEKDGFIYVTMTYPSSESFLSYNSSEYRDTVFFCGTVAEAYDAQMDLDVTLTGVKNREDAIGKEALLGMGDSHIFITGEPACVKVFGKIAYTSDNVSVTGKNRAELLTNEEGKAQGSYYIVF